MTIKQIIKFIQNYKFSSMFHVINTDKIYIKHPLFHSHGEDSYMYFYGDYISVYPNISIYGDRSYGLQTGDNCEIKYTDLNDVELELLLNATIHSFNEAIETIKKLENERRRLLINGDFE